MSQFHVIEYQGTWPSQFEQVAAELRPIFAPAGFRIEHIGSTSVPGLCAKPVLDVLLGVKRLQEVEARASALVGLGYVYRPEYEDQLPGRRYFVRRVGTAPRVHLHSVVLGSQSWRQYLRFRDLLREDTMLRMEYADLKRQLSALHASDKAAYGRAKEPFIQQALAKRSSNPMEQ